MALYGSVCCQIVFWSLASLPWQALGTTSKCVKYQLSAAGSSFVEKPNGPDSAAPEMVERYGEGTWFTVGLFNMEYLINSSSTLSLALDAKAEYIYTPSFMLKIFTENPWLKYRVLDFAGKRRLLQAIRKRLYARRWFTKRTPLQEITQLLSDQFFSRLSSRTSQLMSTTAYKVQKEELLHLLEAADVAGSISRSVRGNNTESVFSWVESIKRNPFSTVMQVIAHSFNSSLGGVAGLSQQSLNQSCFALAHKSGHILSVTSLMPGGILGKIMQVMVQSFLRYFHPFLLPFKGAVSILLAILCRLGVPRIVHQVFTRLLRAKRRLGRAASALWYKYVGLRGDPIGRNMLDGVLSRTGIVMITLLFQLHAVDVDMIRRDAKIEGALLAGAGTWALSDGLFVGLKDFGQVFRELMSAYIHAARGIFDFCSGNATLEKAEVKRLQALLNGTRSSQKPVATRLHTWCQQHSHNVRRLGEKLSTRTYGFAKQVVKVLRLQFRGFTEYLSNIMAIFYEMTFSTLESEARSALSGEFGRPEYEDELRTLLARQEAQSRSKPESAMPRMIFRKPWMKVAIQKLASGYFLAAGALSLLNAYKRGDLAPGTNDAESATFSAYADLAAASNLIRSALRIIFGKFLHSQALISTAKGHKSRMTVYDFIAQCQEPTAAEHSEVCGDTVTQSIDDVKFIAKSMLALNAGVAGDPEDLVLTDAFASDRNLDVTAVFSEWREWLLSRMGTSRKTVGNLVSYADVVSSKEKVHGFIELLRTTLEHRLRFYRFEVEHAGALRLFDINGRSALFQPRSQSVMKEFLRHLKPNPLDSPAAFVVQRLSEGQLFFAQAPALPLDGFLTYENERSELSAIQRDPLAVKELLVALLTRLLGRPKAETVARLLLVLHRQISQMRDHNITDFLRNLSPKMFFDGVLILSDYQQQSTFARIDLERGQYSFPFSLSFLKALTMSTAESLFWRWFSGDSSHMLSYFSMSILHSVYQKIVKIRTGRTKVLEHFQKNLLHVVDELDAGRLTETFPECAFLLSPDEPVAFKAALKCALYRFQKLGSTNLQKGAEKGISTEQLLVYLEAAVEYLERVKLQTSWRTFFNLKAFRSFAGVYRKRAAKYTYEELRQNFTAHASEAADPVTAIGKLTESYREALIPPEEGQGSKEILASIHAGLSKVAKFPSERLRAAMLALQGKIVRTLGAESIPKSLRIWNAISGIQFFGALEYAEFKAFPDTQAVPADFIKVTDLSLFGSLLLALEPMGLYLENAAAMYSIVSEMRTVPLVTPEITELVEDIRKKVQAMKFEDVRVAAGYVASQSDSEGPLKAARARALLSLQKGEGFPHGIDALTVSSPTYLRFVLKALHFPQIFEQMKTLSEDQALKILRFRPRGSLTVGFPFKKTILPLRERLVVDTALERLRRSGVLDKFAALEGQQERGRNGELTCLRFYEELRHQKRTDNQGALRLGSYHPHGGGQSAMAGCSLFFSLRAMQKSGRTGTTVEDMLREQYHQGLPIIGILKQIGSPRTNFIKRVKLMREINPLLSVVYKIATTGGLDASLNGYSLKTGHLSFQSREEAGVRDQPLYDLFSQVVDFLDKDQSTIPDFFKIQLSSYYAEEWIKFLETERLATDVEKDRKIGLDRNTSEVFKYVSSVYSYYDLIDYHISLRQRSIVPVDAILKNASRSLLEQPSSALPAYGLAMTNLDLGEEIKKAKLSCYDQALTDYSVYIQMDRQSQEMWRIDCVHKRLAHGGSFPYSVASLTPDEVALLIDALENELRKQAESRYTTLLQGNVDVALLRKKAWSFITLPHVSLKSAPRLTANLYLAKIIVNGLRRQLPWSAIVENIAETREDKLLSREPHERGPPVYSSTERPYLYNPFQISLDFLAYLLTSKIQRLRLPKLLLHKRALVLARLPLIRRKHFPREIRYAEALTDVEQGFNES